MLRNTNAPVAKEERRLQPQPRNVERSGGHRVEAALQLLPQDDVVVQ